MSILVIAEQGHRITAETIAAAQQIGKELGKPVEAAVIGKPGDLASTIRSEMPLCLGASGSVRAASQT